MYISKFIRSRKAAPAERAVEIGWALALIATFCFSFAPPVARFAILDGFDSTALLLVRMIIATTLFAITLAVTDRQKLLMPRQGLLAATGVGAVNAVGMVLFFFSLNFLEASLTSMILALSPAIVLSLLALRGERLTRRHLVRLGLALAGVYLLIGPTGAVDWFGASLTLLATFFFSLQMAMTQWTLIGYPARSVMFYVTGTMTIFVAGWWLATGAVWSAPGPNGWLAVIILAVVSTYLARLGYFNAVTRIGSGQLALLGPVETLLSVIWSILFLGERLAPLQAVGGALILVSALLAVRRLGRVRLRIPRR
jgi:drug/metabolite transporter (DMT)-like permease